MENVIVKSGEKQSLKKEYHILKQLEAKRGEGHHCFPIAYEYEERGEMATLFLEKIASRNLNE